ncbi:MAG: hypothetical protein HZY73_13205 [Micropruina sp.]|nr:MAG: hypothetical protein HZY73_13205 [Micropruina sp.]
MRSYRLVFSYADRKPLVLRGSTGPCAVVGAVNRDSLREGASFFGGLRKIWAGARELQPPRMRRVRTAAVRSQRPRPWS